MILRILKWLGLTVLALLTLLVISNCTMLGLNYASLETANKPDARPLITASTRAEWEAGREALKREFETHVYGPWPDGLAVSFGETLVADADYLSGKATLEQTEITLGTGEGARVFRYTIAWPRNASGPMPVLIGQTFGSTCYVFGSTAILDSGGKPCSRTEFRGFAGFMLEGIFGEYIVKAPVERYIDAGYAYASFQASDVIRDRKDEALAQLAAHRRTSDPERKVRTGELIALLYRYRYARADAIKLLRFIDWLIRLPRPLELALRRDPGGEIGLTWRSKPRCRTSRVGNNLPGRRGWRWDWIRDERRDDRRAGKRAGRRARPSPCYGCWRRSSARRRPRWRRGCARRRSSRSRSG